MIRRLAVMAAAVLLLLAPHVALAQTVTLDLGDGGSSTGQIVQLLALLTVLSLAPAILITVTSFTRIIVVLSFLRSALGTQQTPPNIVLVSLALFLTGFVMAPTLEASYNNGIAPLMENKITEADAFTRTAGADPRLHDGACAQPGPGALRRHGQARPIVGPQGRRRCASSSRPSW